MVTKRCEVLEKLAKNWSSKDKDEALTLFKDTYKLSQPSIDDMNNDFVSLLYDFLSLGINESLDADEIGEFCQQLMTSLDSTECLPSHITDLLAVLDAEVMCSDNKASRKAFKDLVNSLVGIVGEELLKERLDMDTLEFTGFIPSKNNYNQKYVKTKTKIFYKQQKFNLFREESEGYSKLVAELGHESLTGVSPNAVLDSIKSLIGRFSLDPNRVLDVILEIFEFHLEDRAFFVPLLKTYPCESSTFINILGFKFHGYQVEGDVSQAPPTSSSLYQLTAILLNEELVDLDSLLPHLSLSMEDFQELHKSIMDQAMAIAKKANVVSLVDKSDEDKEKEVVAEQAKRDHHEKLLSLEVNQILGICHACLELGDWKSAQSFLDRLPPYLAMGSPLIVESLCNLLSHMIEPLYRMHAPRGTKPSPPSILSTPQCHSFNDLLPTVMDILYHLGPHLHTDTILLCKVVRIGKAYFKETFNHSYDSQGSLPIEKDLMRAFISVIDEVILPSLSLLNCNCGMAEEVWSMIRLLPYETRYMLYGYWKNQSYDRHPDLMTMKADILNKGKYIMKRLTKDNVKPSGRQIGKLNNSNPGIIFDYVLSQIQRYDNFIIPVVDSLKYLTPLAYDVLAYCIIEALGNPQKERLKHEDTNLSSWLQGLANFCANVFKKYPIELTGLLQYVTNQLKAGKSFDLLVLKEVIQKMAGIEISDEVTSSQLEAMAGGELLKAEGGYFSQVRNTKKSSQRLREALVDSNLCLPLCLLTAQQRDCIVFRDGSNMHLKLVGCLYDHCMDTLVQFGGFLSSHLSPEEYSKRVPSLDTLVQEYRITGDVAFFLYRPKIMSTIGVKFAELEKAVKASNEKTDRKSIMSRQEKHFVSACEEIIGPIIESIKPLQPPRVWEDINRRLYVVFWSLSLYDLHVPKDRYNEEIGKAKEAIQTLENNQEMPTSKKKKEQERSQVLIDKLQEEKKRQEDNNQLVMSWLKQEKDTFFNSRVTKSRTLTQFLQLCIFPRCCFTTTDAVYCAKFVQTLHLLETPNFSTLLFLDRVFSDVSYTVSSCTENEVRRYGHFLSHLLEMVSRWQNSDTAYNAECANTPGFISMMRSSGSNNEKQYLDYENYRHITFKWHFKLTKSLVICLESGDYIQIRNGLILLTKVLPHYPKVQHLYLALEKRVEKIMEEEKEKRQDLYVLAIGYAGMLKSHKPNLVPEQDFHKKIASDSETKLPPQIKKDEKESSSEVSTPLSNGRDDKVKAEKPVKLDKPKTVPEKIEKSKVTADKIEKPKVAEKIEKPKIVEKLKVVEKTTDKITEKIKVVDKVDKSKTVEKVEKPKVVERSKTKDEGNDSSPSSLKSGGEGKDKEDVREKRSSNATTPTPGEQVEGKKITDKTASRSGSSDSTSANDSPARAGQRRTHPSSTTGDGPTTEPPDKEPKRRKMEETNAKTPVANNDAKPSTGGEKSTSTPTPAKPDRKRERPSAEKESPVTDGTKKRKESPVEPRPPPSKESPSEPKEKKRILKFIKTEKIDIGKKRPKSPINDKDDKTKKHITSKPPLKKPA